MKEFTTGSGMKVPTFLIKLSFCLFVPSEWIEPNFSFNRILHTKSPISTLNKKITIYWSWSVFLTLA